MTYGLLLKKLKQLTPTQLRQRCLIVDPSDTEVMGLAKLEILASPDKDDALPKGRVILQADNYA
jgi:hypothetical protein